MKMKKIFLCLSLSACLIFSGSTCFASETENFAEQDLKTNLSGETYGSGLFSKETPDLILATATNGNIGYVKNTDLSGPVPSSPEEALKTQRTNSYTIPVYELDGESIIGEFIVQAGISDPQEIRGIATSSQKYFSVQGHSHYNNSRVMTYNFGSVQGRVNVSGSRTVNAGWYGTAPRLYNSAGQLVASAGYSYNSSPVAGFETFATYNASSGSYYANGYSRVWNSGTSSYVEQSTYNSPMQGF